MIRTPLVHWLSLRLRIVLVLIFITGALLPPYVPASATIVDEVEAPSQQFLFVEEGFLMKTSSLGEQGSRLAYGEGLIHQVKEGDSLERIADRYEIDVATLRWANGMTESSTLRPGQELIILPVDGVIHTVRRGQTLGRIAQLYDIPMETIARQNNIQGGFIVAGQQLIIPGGKPITGTSIAAARDQALLFAEQLPGRDIKLQLNLPDAPRGTAAAPAVSAIISQTLLQMPCENCFVTQKYRAGHYAYDLQTRGGGPIFAAEAGTVIRADLGWNGGYGNVVEIDHGNGLTTLYAHNRTLGVDVGQSVARGEQIATMGNTGLVHGPTGIHLHFEVKVDGVKKNPGLYFE